MNILSLFDGMSCGQIALNRLGIKYDKYFASEVDKHAIKVTMHNFPGTIQLGDVRDVKASDLPEIILMMGGSPCQSFSFAGKRKGMSTKCEQEILSLDQYLELKSAGFEFEGQSYLFWEYVRLLHEVKPKYFLLENVLMEEKWEKVITKTVGVHPIMINSALVSAQNRKRLYWTNIGLEPRGLFDDLESTIEQPKDKGILLKDILQHDVDDKYYLSERAVSGLENIIKKSKESGNGWRAGVVAEDGKCNTIDASYFKGYDGKRPMLQIVAMRGRNPDNPKSRESGLPTQQQLEPRNDGKTNCLTSVQKDNLVRACDYRSDEGFRFREDGKTPTLMARAREDRFGAPMVAESRIRRLTPVECCRLQTVPDDYFKDKEGNSIISETQQYKCLGNGWTIDVICHLLSYIIVNNN